MALETDFNVSPYFDDYNETKDFYKILFRPGVAVQARELNQFQTILQKQVERFGDNIFKRGTIIDGCNFSFHSTYPYVKLVDTQKDGLQVIPSSYVGYFAKSTNPTIGVKAFIHDYQDGFESTDPDLKTVYLNYLNSGANGTTNTFTGAEVIQIYDPQYAIFGISVTSGGSGFSNADSVYVVPSIIVNTSVGTFSPGNILVQGSATVTVVSVDSTTLATSNQAILTVSPNSSQLSTASINSTAWTITNATAIANGSVTSIVEGIIGDGASAVITTDSVGKIIDFTMSTTGSGYSSLPSVVVKSTTGTVGSLTLNPRNYIANVQIAAVANAIGNGYAFGVSEGIIYQKGYFSRVQPQTVIVSKYNQNPNSIVVGFDTAEQIIDSNIDTSLLDNATGTENVNAPGANRLKLTPDLVVMSAANAEANDNFFVLSAWSEGRPYKQNQQTAYNKINDEMARRTYDESGDYVINKFQVTSRSPQDTTKEGSVFSVIVDPGVAYIDGYRVETKANYVVDVPKGNDIAVTNNQSISLDYGNYIRVKEVGGLFQFNTGDTINLYDTKKEFISNTAASSIGNTEPPAAGTLIGTANMRSMLYFDGTPGTSNAAYKLYLFNVNMLKGKNFRDVKSVRYLNSSTSANGIADVILTPDASANANIALLEYTSSSRLLFPSGVFSLKDTSNNYYTYRTVAQNKGISNAGVLTVGSLATGEYFPYTGSLSDSARRDIYVVSTYTGLRANNESAGTVAVLSTSPNVTGTSTTFLSDYQVGDWVYIANTTTGNSTNKIVNIVNNTLMILDSNCAYSNASSKTYRYFPKNVPITLTSRGAGQTAHSVNVDTGAATLTIQFKYANGVNMTFPGSTDPASNAAVGFNIERQAVSQITTTANRGVFVKIQTSNNVANTVGPWCLGVPDVFRLRAVYIGNSSVDTTYPNVIDDFYADHNQNADFYDLGYLYKRTDSNLKIASTDYLLVQFDYGTITQNGFLTTKSYTGSSDAAAVATYDGLSLSSLDTRFNTFEISEVFTKRGEYFDLTNTIDFRPRVANTATPAGNSSPGSAPINPNTNISFGATADTANDKKFPVPQSVFKSNMEQYLGRIDAVFVDREGAIFTKKGTPVPNFADAHAPSTVDYAMRLNNLVIAPYPNIPQNVSNTFAAILNRRVASEKFSNTRLRSRYIQENMTSSEIIAAQPMGYTMKEIGNLERRISDLEYYVSLSLLESDMKDRTIPSRLDPKMPRYKYGFFVDDFSTANFADLDNKSYAATIENDDVVPQKEMFNITHDSDLILQSYIDYPLITQYNATGNAAIVVVNTAVTVVVVNTAVTVANTWAIRKEPSAKKSDSYNVTMSTISAPVTLYGHFYSGADEISIYQGNTLIKTATNAANLTDADKTKLKSKAVPSDWFKDVTFKDYSLSSNRINNSFKITWTHNPSAGLNYTIKVTNDSIVWRYALEYPINSSDVSTVSTVTATPVIYQGVMTVSPDKMATSIILVNK
jgi:hypothetical protein